MGNYAVAILKITESYDELALGLQDIYEKAKDLEVLTIEGNIYKILFFLGGDWKFLAIVCGIDSAVQYIPVSGASVLKVSDQIWI